MATTSLNAPVSVFSFPLLAKAFHARSLAASSENSGVRAKGGSVGREVLRRSKEAMIAWQSGFSLKLKFLGEEPEIVEVLHATVSDP